MEKASPTSPGVFASLKRLLSLTLAVAENRLELLLVEFQEERLQFFELLLLAGIVVVLVALTLAIITATIVVICVQSGRLGLLFGLILFYVVISFLAFWRLRKRLKDWEPFSATLAELKKDKACLAEKS